MGFQRPTFVGARVVRSEFMLATRIATERGRGGSDAALESATEGIRTLKANTRGHAFDGATKTQESPPGLAQAQFFHEIRRCVFKNFPKNPGKVARTKAGALGQGFDCEPFIRCPKIHAGKSATRSEGSAS